MMSVIRRKSLAEAEDTPLTTADCSNVGSTSVSSTRKFNGYSDLIQSQNQKGSCHVTQHQLGQPDPEKDSRGGSYLEEYEKLKKSQQQQQQQQQQVQQRSMTMKSFGSSGSSSLMQDRNGDGVTTVTEGVKKVNIDVVAANNDIQTNRVEVVEQEEEEDAEAEPVRLFVGQVPETMVEDHIIALFRDYGVSAMDVAIIRDKHTSRHRHCAFVTVPSREQANQAIDAFHNKKYLESMSNPMQVKEANQPKPKQSYFPAFSFPITSPNAAAAQFYGLSSPSVGLNSMGYNPFVSKSMPMYVGTPTVGNSMYGVYGAYMYNYPNSTSVSSMAAYPAYGVGSLASPMAMNYATTPVGIQQSGQRAGASEGGNFSKWPVGAASNNGWNDGVNTPMTGTNFNYSSNYYVPQQSTADFSSSAIDQNRQSSSDDARVSRESSYDNLNVTFQKESSNGYNEFYKYGGGNSMGNMSTQSKAMNSGDLYNSRAGSFHTRPENTSYTLPSDPLKSVTYVEGPEGANLFVNNLPEEVTDDDLARLFSSHGRILSHKVFVDKYTHKSKGFGFVSFGSVHEAQEAIHEKNGYEIKKDQHLVVELKRSKRTKFPDFF